MVEELHTLRTVDIIKRFQNKSLTPTIYTQALIERVQQYEHLNALQYFDPEYCLREAHTATQAIETGQHGLLTGVPYVAKDNINTIMYPTSACTPALLGHVPNSNADVINLLTQAGAIVGAKAGMHELAFGITSNNTATGAVHNPHDTALIAGGSSGGSAAAVAAGLFPFALGTDTGGSCRIPASLCGIVGFRPSTSRYPMSGVVPISHTRDTVGCLARCVEDVVVCDQLLSGSQYKIIAVAPRDIVLGVPEHMLFDNLEPYVKKVIDEQLSSLKKAGVSIVPVQMDNIWPHNEAVGFPVVLYECMRDLPAYLAQHAPSVSFPELVKAIASPDVAAIVESQLGDGAMPESVYLEAINLHRPAMQKAYQKLFQQYGLTAIAFPTTPLTACAIGNDETVLFNGSQQPTFTTYIRNTDLGSNLGVPGISLPCTRASGLPVGLALDGLRGQDELLLSTALTIQRLMH